MTSLNKSPNVPRYDFGLPDFLENLRNVVFKNKTAAADYFRLNRTTIFRYEQDNQLRPPIGYIACLAMIYMDKQKEINEPQPEMYEHLLIELNKAIRAEYRGDAVPFKTWEQLTRTAIGYLDERHSIQISRLTPSKSIAPKAPTSEVAELEKLQDTTTNLAQASNVLLPKITDPTDQRIWEWIKQDPSITDSVLAQKLGISRQAVNPRRKSLEKMGYQVRLSRQKK